MFTDTRNHVDTEIQIADYGGVRCLCNGTKEGVRHAQDSHHWSW